MIQSGSVFVDSNTPSWTLHTGSGDRSFTTSDVKFNPPFPAPPAVALSLAGVDADRVRVGISADDVEADEFNIVIHTWADTLLYGVRVTWIAHD